MAKKKTKSNLDKAIAEIRDGKAEPNKKQDSKDTENTDLAGTESEKKEKTVKECPFLDRISDAKVTGDFRGGVQQIERTAKVETASGVITIPVAMYVVEYNDELTEFPTKKEAILWLRENRKANRVSGQARKAKVFRKKCDTIRERLVKLQDSSPTDDIASTLRHAIDNLESAMEDIDNQLAE